MNLRFFTATLLFMLSLIAYAQGGSLSGRVATHDRRPVAYAAVRLKGTAYGATTDERGHYHLKVPAGRYRLSVTALGHRTYEADVELPAGRHVRHAVVLRTKDTRLGEAVVRSAGISRVKSSAYNVVAVDARDLHNSTQNLSDAVGRLPGMKLRETGGVGSDMQLQLDGFSGRQVKVFIDGVPQDGVGSSFSLNNIPINFAERIEVYKGVVPVGFGADALGGVINIVTGQKRRRWWADASYSYGSFNTHKSYVNAGQTLKNGFTYELNAFQNYSDNDYHINSIVQEFRPDGTSKYTKDTRRVRRFHDTYHNEAVVGKLGLVGKSWADRLLLSVTYSHMYKEIQNGVRQEIVFGQKHRRGWNISPAIEYYDRTFLVKGLDMRLTANYNYNQTTNIDTSAYEYNWYGERRYTGSRGEQSYQDNEQRNRNWNVTLTSNYRPAAAHLITLSHVYAGFKRDTRSHIGATNVMTDYTSPKRTEKHITGLSYRYRPSKKWNATVFGKYYFQRSTGPVSLLPDGSIDPDGLGNYVSRTTRVSALGYGAAATYFLTRDWQLKLSYEKARRLPTTDELFGDDDLEAGRAGLKAERSDNANVNLSYGAQLGRHGLYADAGFIFRHTRDYIRRSLGKHGAAEYGYYENFGRVQTLGYNLSARYSFGPWANVGVSYNELSARDVERYRAGGTQQRNPHYKDRIPNQPYRFANFDATLTYPDITGSGSALSLGYDGTWQHDFPLTWESIGAANTKKRVPTQLSHNLSLTYSLKNGRYNFSLECRNLTDARLYDNYSLQKAGRAVYGKVRISFGG